MSKPAVDPLIDRPRIAIVGGGWAGLTAAVELVAAGAKVTLFESAKQLGGRARGIDMDGRRLDNGQHLLIGAYRETLRLMQMVGVNTEQALQRRPLELNFPRAGFHLRLPQLPAPFNLAIGLLRAQGCSWHEKLGAARFIRALQSTDFHLSHDGSVAELLDRHRQGSNLRHFLWETLCLAALNTAPANASAQIFANVLRDSLGGRRSATDLLLPARDLDQLFPDAALRFIEAGGGRIFRSSRVEIIARTATLFEILGERYDQVIIAVAPQHAATLLRQQNQTGALAEAIEHLTAYTYEPIGTVYAAYPADVRLPLPMLGLETSRSDGIGQWVFDRGQLGGNAGLLSFVLSGHGDWEKLDDAVLLATLHDELGATLGKSLPTPHWHRTIRERRATFSCRPGLKRPPARTPIPGLWLAGDYVCANYPATLEGAVRSGVTAAQGVLAESQYHSSSDRPTPM